MISCLSEIFRHYRNDLTKPSLRGTLLAMAIRFSSVLFALLALCLSGCGQRETPVERANQDRILLRANGTEPAALDPHLVTGVMEHNILTSLLEGLIRPDPKTLAPLPGVAEAWDISSDRRVYTFHLRPEARWSNGDPVTAKDFIFSYERILSPKLAAEYASMLYPMVGAEAFNTGELTDFSQVGVKALDEHTLEITLKEPTPYFLSLLTHYTWFPVHPPTILKHGEIDQRESRWTRPGNFVGNGPFTLEEWRVHDYIDVKKNPLYWDRDSIWLNGVRFLPIDNRNTEERAFRSGQVHVTYAMPVHKIEPYKESGSEALLISPYLGTYYYAINVNRPPLDDVRIRQALSLAIDRETITRNITKAGQIPAPYFTPPDTAGYTAECPMSLDMEQNIAEAQRLMAEAGYPNGEGMRDIELLYNTSDSHKPIAEAIQRMWQEHLGINATLLNKDWKTYLIARREGDFDIVRAGWIGDYNDPSTFLDLLTSWSGNNASKWSTPDYDTLIREAAKTTDQTARYELFQQAEAILMEEMPLIPIYFYVSAYLVDSSVQGWYPNILDQHPYQGIRLETATD
ncbi:peptide ABC transporter substrate-binding protein [Cerasicoccus arenae]|uniref:Peptide ABC transporter substrate-binding protein n=1 Tax=Cerasicoccus arenae TaxID=424488 RepID=A0A8J3DGJ3_9BACT|nr:peptide ABC transporter substrate-binding protein [Cerasicoccus arenae]MBK1856989.1 peptide ABC transporter substrate-binding protein [Cerasicoccus arenae]GHB90262.1 peptide ABC transporter substrate-binding protein [Cerasicoccus arenae]